MDALIQQISPMLSKQHEEILKPRFLSDRLIC